MRLIQALPDGPLDIVGDIHGEYEALCELLHHLGYDDHGRHPDGRTLVFVGDFCDRGPDSPAVMMLARQLMHAGGAMAVMGNHELNLLRKDPKDGSGWFFQERALRDHEKYAPFKSPTEAERQDIKSLVASLPLVLERADLRVVHAAWHDPAIEILRTSSPLPGTICQSFDRWEHAIKQQARDSGQAGLIVAERESWKGGLDNPARKPPLMHAVARYDVGKQMGNPVRVLTSGVERVTPDPFFNGGKWRFTERVPWWDDYNSRIPVIIGHYWRQLGLAAADDIGKHGPDLFDGIPPLHWHGKHQNVFCVDFSAGGKWLERKSSQALATNFRLAALRWPERSVMFDDGSQQMTAGFGGV
ncbi:metallophosphoesterase [Pusillimonas sp. MFBS29]|uniref:metallophosphoesterase n=1 Tax=Pusillimonas sp. MFBS29 TaxID=2886690 RepID=UPI001D11C6B5|nr:metallophosphoesterase [Pusillimonas sp. MFBS29]MCC2596244.1 metallophosphoesterase [Pusillimonas sp. MFBS29]